MQSNTCLLLYHFLRKNFIIAFCLGQSFKIFFCSHLYCPLADFGFKCSSFGIGAKIHVCLHP